MPSMGMKWLKEPCYELSKGQPGYEAWVIV